MDSARLLGDLDLLATPAWQTLPAESGRDADLLAKVRQQEHGHGTAAYGIALQALWHNCPDALEVALSRVQTEVRLMSQKLEFTRIRQAFVALCIEFHSGSSALARLLEGTAALQVRCAGLIEQQSDEQESALPGLITKRDTTLLRTRMGEVSKELGGAGSETAGGSRRPSPLPGARKEAWTLPPRGADMRGAETVSRPRRSQSMQELRGPSQERASSLCRPPASPASRLSASPSAEASRLRAPVAEDACAGGSEGQARRLRRPSSRRPIGAATSRTGRREPRPAGMAGGRPPTAPIPLDDEAFAAVYAAALHREEERRRRDALSSVFHRVAASPEAEYGSI